MKKWGILKDLSFRDKLVGVFLAMGILFILIMLLNNKYQRVKQESLETTYKIKDIKIELFKMREMVFDLLNNTNQQHFHEENGFENLMKEIDENHGIIRTHLTWLKNKDQYYKEMAENMVLSMDSLRDKQYFFIEKIKQRGFKNYGIEGKMRDMVHLIEDEYNDIIPLTDLMYLRRYEKDFIIRKEIQYVKKLDYKTNSILEKIDTLSSKRAADAKRLLIAYQQNFHDYFDVVSEIGFSDSSGLKKELLDSFSGLDSAMSLLEEEISLLEREKINNVEIMSVFGWLFLLLVVVFGSLVLSKMLTWKIRLLSHTMNHYVNSGFKSKKNLNYLIGEDEIGDLFKSFKILEDQVSIHFEEYKLKVEKRTQEILEQKKRIEDQKKEIEDQNKLLEIRNTEIVDSIRYAEKIQKSILLNEDYLQWLFKEHFILFKPKDIVSGDFYWGKKIGETIYFAIADCTGHGVPGAFMSIIGHNVLTYTLLDKKITEPAEILNSLNENVKSVLHQTRSVNSIKDGMDIALFSFDTKTYKLKFSGAQRPLIIARGDEIIELKGNRFPAGGYVTLNDHKFTQEEIKLFPGDQIFAFSDGYIDQFGGEKNKKFKYRPFKELIASIIKEEKEKQREILEESFEVWKGNNYQVDDICVFSAKL